MDKVFIHHLAEVQTENIGAGTKIWQYSIILKNAKIGANCNINSHTFIENKVIIGNNVTVKCGVYLWDGLRIEDDVFVGPNATFSNDKFPKSKKHLKAHPLTNIKKGASIGAGAIILPGIQIGTNSLIGAGAVVTKNIKNYEIVAGNPARVIGKITE
jgi:UDP-2-acetamido-3-amino-2,3-dideoxy-glucuronate N-acetyltransferase